MSNLSNYIIDAFESRNIELPCSEEILEDIANSIYYAGVLDGNVDRSKFSEALQFFMSQNIGYEQKNLELKR